jgi:hypothetical protein
MTSLGGSTLARREGGQGTSNASIAYETEAS